MHPKAENRWTEGKIHLDILKSITKSGKRRFRLRFPTEDVIIPRVVTGILGSSRNLIMKPHDLAGIVCL